MRGKRGGQTEVLYKMVLTVAESILELLLVAEEDHFEVGLADILSRRVERSPVTYG
jgi:hypothetical protein